MRIIPSPSDTNDFLSDQVAQMLASYEHWLGKPLAETSEQLFHAPFVVLCHDTSPDPLFNYANQTAMDLFELSWDEIIGMPSRNSAEPVNQAERAQLIERVTRDGYIDDYSGVRISKTGKRFKIDKAIVWNVLDESGTLCGQAATFDSWKML